MEPVVPSVFDEMEQYKPLNYASTGQRFANFIIDTIVVYMLAIIFSIVLVVLDNAAPFGYVEFITDESTGTKILTNLLGVVFSFLVYFLIEGL
jgi:hypothetical protein